MRGCERHHDGTKASGAARLLAVALVAIVAAAPLARSFHEITVRHVRCAEHGELTHVHVAAATERDAASTRAASSSVAESRETDSIDGHEHCASAVVVRARLDVAIVRTPVRFEPPPAVVREVPRASTRPGRTCVLASAPKTSPPSA